MSMHEGGCLCGAVRYRVEGEPARSSVCSCTCCQRRTGTLDEPKWITPLRFSWLRSAHPWLAVPPGIEGVHTSALPK